MNSVNSSGRILVAGVGNVFMGDDAFGVEVARRLLEHPLPGNVNVVDFGIRGLHLAYSLLENYDLVILADAVSRGGSPGTLYVIEPEMPVDGKGSPATVDAHDLDVSNVLQLVASMGGQAGPVLLVGCEVAGVEESANVLGGLSPPVQDAACRAAEVIETLINRHLSGQQLAAKSPGRPEGDNHEDTDTHRGKDSRSPVLAGDDPDAADRVNHRGQEIP